MTSSATTYQQALILSRESVTFKGYLCIAQSSLETLQIQKDSFLHPIEMKYFSTLKHEKRQHSYLLGRYCAKQAILDYLESLSFDPTQFYIDKGIFQQPVVYCCEPSRVQISISHSEQIAIALAFPEAHPMGIDFEKIDRKHASTIQSQLTAQELYWLCPYSSSPDHAMLLTIFWTAKEALSKVLKTGLMCSSEALALKQLEQQGNSWIGEFQHFAQYQTLSFKLNDFICSIALPKRTQLSIDIPGIQNYFASPMT